MRAKVERDIPEWPRLFRHNPRRILPVTVRNMESVPRRQDNRVRLYRDLLGNFGLTKEGRRLIYLVLDHVHWYL